MSVNDEAVPSSIIAAARKSLAVYTALVHKTDKGKPAFPPDHIKNTIIPVLENPSIGHTVIVAPPASAKTNTMIAFCCWMIGRNPNIHIAYISSSAGQAKDRSLAIRDIISDSPEYKMVFPDIKANPNKGWSQDQWYVQRENVGDKDPTMKARGTEGDILGSRFDLVILDDIADKENMATLAQQENVIDMLQRTLDTRLTPDARIIMIATRWAENDPVQWAKVQGYHYVHIPALKEKLVVDETTGEEKIIQESYWPKQWPSEKLRCPEGVEHSPPCCKYFSVGGAFNFAQQYMGLVQDNSSAYIKSDWWKFYEELPQLRIGGIFVDMAHTESKLADYSVILVAKTDGINFYFQELQRFKAEFPELKRRLLKMREKYSLPIFVEKSPGSLPLIQELRTKLNRVFAWDGMGKSKIARVEANLIYWEAGNVWLPKDADWSMDLIQECFSFPKADHDDQVDACTMALSTLKSATQRWTVV